jgi:sugar lactone lactonase YvrE
MRHLVLLISLFFLQTLPAAEIRTIAGDGTKGYSGDGGPADKARMNNVFGLVRGPDGALYVCDTDNQRVRRIGSDGLISTVAGNGKKGYSGDGGPATEAALNEPYEVRFDAAGDLYIVERLNHVVRKVALKTGVISTVAGVGGQSGFGGDGGPAVEALLHEPHSIQFDGEGLLYICDIKNHRVRRVNLSTGRIETFAGTGKPEATPEGAVIAGTPLRGPRALDLDGEGNLWLALREGNAIFRMDLKAGTLHHVAGAGGKPAFKGNGGPAREATLGGPKGIAVAANGNVYFADTETHSIRMIDMKKGTVEVVAGTGERGDGPEPNPLECKLNRPHGVYVDRDGAIYIGDSETHRVRVVR